ncbi:substrate-binding periplasmic protein [Zooshikella harenae]|uniref:Transporter substrate-binding domain-containing protein n=1 Tax=Zooshikella harenae TaxID=2827238 RepID=A0ABS5ZGF4_9GAMM|nr:transporter substrate-binding domain-containing protein [Zooshikella harenae]MBU2712062.1 transporter substrate-binding domain-containing protein [Zooshikella harenae]
MPLVITCFCITFLSLVSVVTFCAERKNLLIATGDYPPWTSEVSRGQGFVNHVITEAFAHRGFTVYYHFLPWARSYGDTERGKFSALSYWACSKKTQKTFYCSDPMHTESYVFFHEKNIHFPKWKKLSDLKAFRIGATRGYTYTKAFWQAYKNKTLDIIVNNDDETSFKMLLKGRLDAVAVSSITGLLILNQKFGYKIANTITFNSKPIVENTAHLLFPKSRKESLHLLKVFNQGLMKIKEDGTYDQYFDDLIMGKY